MKHCKWSSTVYAPTLTVGCLFLVTFCWILPSYLQDKTYSIYFSPEERDIDIVRDAYQQNVDRLQESSMYINTLMAETGVLELPDMSNASKKPQEKKPIHRRQKYGIDDRTISIAVGVISIQRSVEKDQLIRVGYLTQVLAKLHGLATNDTMFKEIVIYICNVDINGGMFEEATRLSTIFDTYIKYNDDNDATKFQEGWEIFEKEKQDYQFCLETSFSYKTDFVIILEDDALPKDDLFSSVHKILTADKYGYSKPHSVIGKQTVPNMWGFMKLYYPERWAGYGSELQHWMELISFGIAGGILFSAISATCKHVFIKYRRKSYHSLAIFVVGSIYAIALAEAIGRPYIMEYISDVWDFHWIIHSRGCCTQATLFPSTILSDLVKYINAKDCDIDYAIDHVLEDYKSDRDMQFYLVEPNLVKHIGMFSSLRSYAKRPAEFI